MSKPYRSRNTHLIALIIEIALMAIAIIIGMVIPIFRVLPYVFIVVGIIGVLILSVVVTLSLIRNERLRDIRKTFKDSNMPLYTDDQTMLLHDIIDEEKDKSN